MSIYNIFKKKKNPQLCTDSKKIIDTSNVPTGPYTQFYEQYIEDNCNEAIRRMESKELDSSSVHAFIRHIPIRGYNQCSENALKIGEDCLKRLYVYSKEMGFVSHDYSYENFINLHLLDSVDIEFLRNGGKIFKGNKTFPCALDNNG